MAKRKEQARKPTKEGKRDRDGRFMGVRIADPPVKPRSTTVREIRRAVATVLGRRGS
jgi:hypothetical protein